MHSPAGSRWRLVDPSGLRIRRFGDDALVFNPVSWETHLLNDLGMRVLDALASGARREPELVAAVYGSAPRDADFAARHDELARFLDELGMLGLVEPEKEVVGEGR
jgi:PqqD family protein of HPr-rel-A system